MRSESEESATSLITRPVRVWWTPVISFTVSSSEPVWGNHLAGLWSNINSAVRARALCIGLKGFYGEVFDVRALGRFARGGLITKRTAMLLAEPWWFCVSRRTSNRSMSSASARLCVLHIKGGKVQTRWKCCHDLLLLTGTACATTLNTGDVRLTSRLSLISAFVFHRRHSDEFGVCKEVHFCHTRKGHAFVAEFVLEVNSTDRVVFRPFRTSQSRCNLCFRSHD